jgi:mono/diheme cytochrome c family protein
MKPSKQLLGLLMIAASLIFAACGGAPTEIPPTDTPVAEAEHDELEEEHAEDEHAEDEHAEDEDAHSPEDHMVGAHDVPDEAAAVPNPIEANEESVAQGSELYAASCAVCHGDTGEGDGPGGASLDPLPADLHEDHVQELTDGGLFFIISHGKPETSMPAWENVLTEDERWHVVNFMRTFADH